jgi:archaellum component FlaC
MAIVNKQNEIENDIKTLKDSYDGFQKKLAYNNTLIEKHESQIIRL